MVFAKTYYTSQALIPTYSLFITDLFSRINNKFEHLSTIWVEILSVKDFKRLPGFNSITFTFSENSNYGWENQKFVDINQQCFVNVPAI